MDYAKAFVPTNSKGDFAFLSNPYFSIDFPLSMPEAISKCRTRHGFQNIATYTRSGDPPDGGALAQAAGHCFHQVLRPAANGLHVRSFRRQLLA